MDLIELQELTVWIERHVKGPGIAARYLALRDVLQSNAQGSQQQPIEPQKEALLDAVRQPLLDLLSLEQQEMLDRMEIGPYIGPRAVAMIEDVLFRLGLDAPTAAQRMGEAGERIERGVARAERIQEGLAGLVDDASGRGPTGVLIRVTFAHDAAISNVVDLKNWSATWHEIARGIVMVHDLAPEDLLVVGAGRGSLIIDFSVNAVIIANTLATILLRSLRVAERVVGIKMKAQELQTLKLKNKQLSREVEKDAEDQKAEAADSIVDDVVKSANIDTTKQGDKIASLKKAVGDLLDFLERGGQVDCILPPEEAEPEEGTEGDGAPDPTRQGMADLRSAVQEIRHLEARLRELEAGKPADDSREAK